MKKADIVVLGAGLGGISMVFDLKAELGKNHQIVLVNKTESFQFTPSNPWVGVGWRTKGDITIELAPLMKKLAKRMAESIIRRSGCFGRRSWRCSSARFSRPSITCAAIRCGPAS